jgi:iron-sulfur cluster repair protein YtfE (RIC family)
MAQQHREHASKLEALLRATVRVRREPHDERARGELATATIALETEFEGHLALEENTIFPAIRELLSPETQESIIVELRRRRRLGTWSR